MPNIKGIKKKNRYSKSKGCKRTAKHIIFSKKMNSPEDVVTLGRQFLENITKRLDECGDLLGIKLLDHIIIGDNGKYVRKICQP